MNPIERLEAIHNEMVAVQFHAPDGWYKKRADIATELRAIISELKQEKERQWLKWAAEGEARVQRDEAVRLVAEEMVEPQADAVLGCEIGGWVIRLRAALEGKHGD